MAAILASGRENTFQHAGRKSPKRIDKYFSNCYILHIQWGIEEDSGGEVRRWILWRCAPFFIIRECTRNQRLFRNVKKDFTVD